MAQTPAQKEAFKKMLAAKKTSAAKATNKPAPKKTSAATKTKTPAKKPGKKIPGKSTVMASPEMYKPSIYLDDGQIPKDLKGAKVGDTVTLQVTGKEIGRAHV